MGSSFLSMAYYMLWLIPMVIVAIAIILYIKNKKTYKYKVRIFRVRENGQFKEANFKGGYIGRKNSAPFFRIKTGMFPWNVIELTETPKVEYMDTDDRVYYKQIDINTFIQMERKFNKGTLDMTPVESDVKYGAILSVQRIKEVLRVEPTWKRLLPYIGMTLVAVVLIVGYAILLNTKCP